ncbi:putative MFS family arabinose efflux permease [Rhizomicrobium palustre]|uniref:Putative MFS family arabinose efflux permease n=1 Tax=Rhizomicrobium palustre TaxID=189966 RepID=A0A846N1G4_9PROT|nr:MFS transporter [Rhizomicrobium palustre]NIK89433.1 putative MFS family arabinose efflux permease [Rhizomicrobium palustre]
MAQPASSTPDHTIPTVAMAVAAGLGVSNLYFNQPLLAMIERAFPFSHAAMYIPSATQLGYCFGLILFLPLGDLLDRRRLIVLQFALLAAVLVFAALAPTAPWLLLASLLVGAGSSVAQQIVPFAATLASDESRGAIVGKVMSGLLCGILLGRAVAGFLASWFGWRAVFWTAVPTMLAAGALMALTLPSHKPDLQLSYRKALASLADLWDEEPVLRRAAMTQGCLFGSFSVFWTVLSLRLQEPLFGLGADAAGLFAILGVAGILAAPMSGHIADRRGPRPVVIAGAITCLLSWLAFGFWNSLTGMIVGVMVLDLGVQSAVVSNQHKIYALRPEARGRINTLFMSGIFIGGAIGSAGASAIYHIAGWFPVCLFGAAMASLGLTIQMLAAVTPRPQA